MSDNVTPPVGDPNNSVTPPVAPVAPPVTPPVTQPAPPPVEDKGTKPEPYVADLGDPQLNYAVAHFVNGLGLRPDSPEIVELLKNGNDAYLRGHVAASGGDPSALEPFLLMANAGRGAITAAEEQKQEKLRGELEGYAGGAEKFTATIEFVKANSTPEQIEEFDKILNMGGIAAQALMTMFQSKMHADPNLSVQGRDAVTPQAGAAVPAASKQYNSRAEWRAAQRALIDQHGYRYETTPEGQALLASFNPQWQ